MLELHMTKELTEDTSNKYIKQFYFIYKSGQ